VPLQRAAHHHAGAEGERARRGQLAAAVALRDLHRRRVGIAGVHRLGRAVDHLRVVGRHVHHVGLHGLDGDELRRRLDHGGAAVHRLHVGRGRIVLRRRGAGHAQLVVVLQAARLGRALAHDLDRVHHVGRVVVVGLPQRGGPRDVARQLVDDGAEGGERLHARVPRLLVGRIGQRAGLEVAVLAEPVVRGGDLLGVGGAGQDLRHQLVGVQRDGRDQLVELFGRRRRVGGGHRCGLGSGACARLRHRGRGHGGRRVGGRRRCTGRGGGLVAACENEGADAQRDRQQAGGEVVVCHRSSMRTPASCPELFQRRAATGDDTACAADATDCVGGAPPSLSAHSHTAGRPRATAGLTWSRRCTW
jgi:hypothetical protein